MKDLAGILDGSVRPDKIPDDWIGEPLPNSEGWRWFDPNNRGNSVRFYGGEEPYVVVTANGQIVGRDGRPTGEYLDD